MAKKTLEDPTMKKTGAMILSFMIIFMMTVTNLAGAYHSAAQVYAAEETDGGEDNADGGTQGGDETGLTNTTLSTGDVTQSGNQVTTITPPQETATAATFTVTFDANGHGTAPDAVTVTEGSTAPKPDDLTAEGFTFDGWFRDANATVEWNFDTDTVNENITLYAGWTENPPAPTLQSNAEITSSTQGDANTENNNAQEGATTSNAGNTASTAQEGTTTSDAGNTGSNAKDEKTTTPDAGKTASAEQEGAKPANDKNEEDNNKTTFTVTFDANGHGTAPDAVTVTEGYTAPKPADLSAEGFTFDGWFRDANATEEWNFDTNTVSEDITLYAGWSVSEPSAAAAPRMLTQNNRGGEDKEYNITVLFPTEAGAACCVGSDDDLTAALRINENPYNYRIDKAKEGVTVHLVIRLSVSGPVTVREPLYDGFDGITYPPTPYNPATRIYVSYFQMPANDITITIIPEDSNSQNNPAYYYHVFLDAEGNEIHAEWRSDIYPPDYNSIPQPTKADDADNVYSFQQWTKKMAADWKYTYTPTFNAIPKTNHTVTVSADPNAGGTVTGGGTYRTNDPVTLEASPATGYLFKCWTKNGSVVSTQNPYSFTVTEDVALTAEFEQLTVESITITLTNNDATTEAPQWVTGDKGKATVTVSPAGALQDVTWSSNNEDAVKIDQNGNIEVVYDSPTNMSPYVMITAEAKDGSRVTATERIEVFSHCHTVRFHPEGGGGSMGPYGSNDIAVYDSGRSKEYKLPDCRFTPPGGKRFKAWRVNGTEYQPDRTITLSGRCSKTDVYAVWEDFTPQVYKITVQTDGNGTAEARKTAVPSGYETVQSALQGTDIYPRVTPNNGYGIATATYSYHDGNSFNEISLINPRMAGLESFTMPAADVTIKVTFKLSGIRLTGLTVSPGTLTPAFDKDILSYDVTVAYDVSEIQATATYPEHTDTDGAGGNTWRLQSNDTVNRRKTFSHALDYGINKLHLSVYETASGSGTDYYLNVTREPAPGAPKITMDALPDGEENSPYVTTALTADNAENATWSLGGGDLPVGLSLSPDGKISGTPTQAGTYSFIVKAEKNGLYDRKELTITINPAPVPAQAYTITLDANGGTVNGNSTYTATTGTDGKLSSLPGAPDVRHNNNNLQFLGWYTAASGGTAVDTSTVFKGNTTVYAQWKDNTPATRMRTVLGGLTGGVPGTKYDTKEKVEDELLYRVGLSRTTANGRWVAYDVKLQVYVNGQWVDATPMNFPADGLTVILPYPSGTGRDTHTFKVAHMFTMTMPGKTHKPGDVETPPATNTDDGIQVTLQGLSPVLITWEEKQGGTPSNPGGGGGSSTGTENGGSPTAQTTATGGLTASGGTNAFATNTGTTTTRTSAGANETNARMAQTGDDFYERLGIHTLLFLAALTTLLANLRKLEEERGIMHSHVRRRRR